MMNEQLTHVLLKLEDKLKSIDFKGYGLHDALNSPILKKLTLNNRILGIIFLQLMKRSPVNLRPVLLTRKGINPKGFGLLISAYVEKYKLFNSEEDIKQAKVFADWLMVNYSKGYSGYCWGYNYDWPNRNSYFPKGTPTIVNTVYIANGFLDLYKCTNQKRYLDVAISTGNFILNDINRTFRKESFILSYTPLDNTMIHNANMLGSSLLATLYDLTKEIKYKDAAQRSMRFSIYSQQNDGSWLYGEERKNSWIDSYHTGYNLLALKTYNEIFCNIYLKNLKMGYNYYLNNFFTNDGEVKYYHNRLYPWDCHAFSHAIITLSTLKKMNSASEIILGNVLNRSIDLFWNERKKYFYYKVGALGTVKINYTRWVQTWMFYALLIYLNN